MHDSVTSELIVIMEARIMLDANKLPEPHHIKELHALCRIAEKRMKPRQPIVFRGNPEDGYIVESKYFINLDGADYAHRLLAQATNSDVSSRSIPAVELETWGGIGKSGEMLSGTEPGVFAQSDSSDVGFQGGSRDQDFSDRKVLRKARDERIAEGATAETDPFVEWANKKLNESRYYGNTKPLAENLTDDKKNDPESARKRVQSAISYFTQQLLESEDTRLLGLHLMDAIDTGIDCEYVGDWPFELF